MLPEVGSISRLTMRNKVVLPAPDFPTSMQVRPSGTVNVTSSTAGLVECPNLLVIAWNAISGMPLMLLARKGNLLWRCSVAHEASAGRSVSHLERTTDSACMLNVRAFCRVGRIDASGRLR